MTNQNPTRFLPQRRSGQLLTAWVLAHLAGGIALIRLVLINFVFAWP
jgi:hypothetical protein